MEIARANDSPLAHPADEDREMAESVERETASLKGFEDFAAKVRRIALGRNLTIPEVLDQYAMPGIDREFKKVIREEYAEITGDPGA